jgi:hypothetical protein
MDKFYNETLNNLEAAIKELETETDCSIQQIEVIIKLIIKCLSNVKEYVLNRGFKNVEEEIRFSSIKSPLLFQSSSIITLSIKSKQRNLMAVRQ